MRGMLIATAVVLAGCGPTAVEPDEDGRAPGILEHYGEDAAIEIPARVNAGEAFVVTVQTFGGGCYAKGDTESSVDGLTAAIRPFDYDYRALIPPDAACTDDLRMYEHEATIRLSGTGIGWVRVYGGDFPAGKWSPSRAE